MIYNGWGVKKEISNLRPRAKIVQRTLQLPLDFTTPRLSNNVNTQINIIYLLVIVSNIKSNNV